MPQRRAAAFAFTAAYDAHINHEAKLGFLDQHPNPIQSGAILAEARSECRNDQDTNQSVQDQDDHG
jgi:hypothetical protein